MGVKIALDAMGGDAAPDINLKGALSALAFIRGRLDILRQAGLDPGFRNRFRRGEDQGLDHADLLKTFFAHCSAPERPRRKMGPNVFS